MDYSILRIFSCLTNSLVDSQKRNKLKSKFKYFIGFTKRVKDFRLWDPEKMSVFTSKDVLFEEKSVLQEKSKTEDKTQGGASDSSADTQEKKVEFSERPKRSEGSEEIRFRWRQTGQEQLRPLRRLVRVTVPLTRYD